ncbi:hypothetical protein CSKR_101241 [Clonorchis sinensis]|uniref:Uncharacterized protein n=1 Tax=Clonorchis sinensis TaxID=79923 RepID=A0A3R7F5V6_CLOSI|nr:hypothetical protein CSKR_101241 [Clonorchis sinensis]
MRWPNAAHSVDWKHHIREIQLGSRYYDRQIIFPPRDSDEMAQWLEHDRKVRGSNPNSASRLFLSRLGQPGSIPALVLPSGGMAVRHRMGATAKAVTFSRGSVALAFIRCSQSGLIIKDNRSAVALFRCLSAMPYEGSTRAGILSGCPGLDRGDREAGVGFEPRTFRSATFRSNHSGISPFHESLRHIGIGLNVSPCDSCSYAYTPPTLGCTEIKYIVVGFARDSSGTQLNLPFVLFPGN